jgi:hypothetical protein
MINWVNCKKKKIKIGVKEPKSKWKKKGAHKQDSATTLVQQMNLQ